jgi:hypothetical protein
LSVIAGNYADPEAVLEALNTLFGISASVQPQINMPEDARAQANSQFSTGSATTSGISSGTGTVTGLH